MGARDDLDVTCDNDELKEELFDRLAMLKFPPMATLTRHRLLSLAAALPLVACGGDGGESTSPAPLPAGPDASVVMTSVRASLLPNQENGYTVTVRNVGAAAMGGATLTVPAVSGFTYESATCSATAGATCPAGTSVQALGAGIALPSMPVGGALGFRLDGVTTGAVGAVVNLSATIALSSDSVPGNNVAQRPMTILAPAAATLVDSVPPPTYADGSPEHASFSWINAERKRCGMGLLRQDARLDAASADHARYLAMHIDNGNLNGLTHAQDPALPGYTGGDGTARARYRGYPGGASDLLGGALTALHSNQTLFGYATYHSLAAQGGARDVGLASAMSVAWGQTITVFNVGVPILATDVAQALDAAQLLAGDAVATYPCGGETLLSRSHMPESPSPFPNADLTTKGPPITIFVREAQQLLISNFALSTSTGAAVPATLLTSAEREILPKSRAVIIPDTRLPANTTFNIVIKGTNEGQRFEKRFAFSTSD